MRANLFKILMVAAICLVASATVYEAANSEDVDIFLDDFQDETVGLLFYDSQEESTKDEDWFGKLSTKILGIFMSKDQFGRSTEDWVELFDDKLHLMRIDVRNRENMRTREEFNIATAPYVVLMDKRRTILREKIDDETFDHVRMLLDRRPNLLHKTGGAALKSFNLEPEAGAPDSKPRVVQFFDLEDGSPTNVEQPVQTQYVNWAPVDVIGPDGKWEQRGRNWVTSYEIPESGITNQKNPAKVHDVQKTEDDPRPQGSATPAPKPQQKPQQQPQQQRQQQPQQQQRQQQRQPQQQRKQTEDKNQGPPPLSQKGIQDRLEAQRKREASAQFQKQAAQNQDGAQTNDNGMPARHPYHSEQYNGYGDINSDHRKFQNE